MNAAQDKFKMLHWTFSWKRLFTERRGICFGVCTFSLHVDDEVTTLLLAEHYCYSIKVAPESQKV